MAENLERQLAPKTPPMTPPKRALQKKLLKEVILFVALIVPRKTLELCWQGYFSPTVVLNLLLMEYRMRGREPGSRIGVRASVKKKKKN